MKALILNSGKGTRMGSVTENRPKCMVKISKEDTILSRQLKLLNEAGIKEVIMTTGPFEDELISYCKSLELGQTYTFVNNPLFSETNYIYSIYLAKDYVDDDIILLHGDLVFDKNVLLKAIENKESCMAVKKNAVLPEKDFKAEIEENDKLKIGKVGIEFFNHAIAAEPLYKLYKKDWEIWLSEICAF